MQGAGRSERACEFGKKLCAVRLQRQSNVSRINQVVGARGQEDYATPGASASAPKHVCVKKGAAGMATAAVDPIGFGPTLSQTVQLFQLHAAALPNSGTQPRQLSLHLRRAGLRRGLPSTQPREL